jgi:hypothetical protein
MHKLIGGMIVGAASAALLAVISGLAVLAGFLASLLIGTVAYFLWHWAAPLYFDFLPVKYLVIPWFHVVLLTWLFMILGTVLFRDTTSSKS